MKPQDRFYSPSTLWIYDFWVHGLSNTLAWRCPTKSVLLPFFQANAGPRHMDIGVGTGYFLATTHQAQHRSAANTPDEWPQHLTLADINPGCLRKASSRLDLPARTECVLVDTLEPLPLPLEKFDSVSLMYTLHCLPIPSEQKGRVFSIIKPHLKPNGTVFGATILGQGVRHNWLAWIFMRIYNWIGMFQNETDGKEDVLRALDKDFEHVESMVVGCVLVFSARNPRKARRPTDST